MKLLMMIVMAASVMFNIHVANVEAGLLSNEISIRQSGVKHGPEFGKGWSEEQKKVWDKTQEFFQLRIVLDWDKLKKLFHKDAFVSLSIFRKAPFDFHELEEVYKEWPVVVFYCTVPEIRIIENVAIVLVNWQHEFPTRPGITVFVWMRQGADWKLITLSGKRE